MPAARIASDVSNLTNRLKQYFGIKGEPVELMDDSKAWRCVFKLRHEDWEPSFSSASQPDRQQDEW